MESAIREMFYKEFEALDVNLGDGLALLVDKEREIRLRTS